MIASHKLTQTRSKRQTLAAAVALALPLAMATATPAWAQITDANQQAAARAEQRYSFSIPTKPLPQAIADFSAVTGLQVLYTEQAVFSQQAPALTGNFTLNDALQRLLAGSGLTYRFTSDGAVTIEKVLQQPADGPLVLGAVTVEGQAGARAGNELPDVYVGGQVARGGKLGFLGNKDVMETPFSQTSYTAQHIQNTQAMRLGEVIESNPSVQRVSGRFYSNDGYFIRGFPVFGWETSYDGIYGLANVRSMGIESIERVELLKGPNAMIYGIPPSGGIGGNVNFVPKRAQDTPITQATLNYLSENTFGGHVDIGRRFGLDDAFGVRVNIAHRNGDTPFDYNSEKATLASMAFDYRGERFRLYANLNYENQKMDAPVFSSWRPANAAVPVPDAPNASSNASPPWTFTETERNFHLVRAEYDFNDSWGVSFAHGWQHVDESQYVAFGRTIINAAGDVTEPTTNRFIEGERDNNSTDVKLSGRLQSGAVSHQLVVGVNRVIQKSDLVVRSVGGSGSISNIYDLRYDYPIPDFTGVVGNPLMNKLMLDGAAVSNTLGFLDDHLQVTLGARHQSISSKNTLTGVTLYDESATTPAFAVLSKISNNVSLYANYIEGLTQAPSPPLTVANFDDVFAPAKSKQREAGVKFDSGQTMLTLAVFEITQPSGMTDPTTNVFSLDGEQRNRGVEVEGYGEIVPGVRLLGGVAYVDPKLVRSQNGTNDGNNAPNVSEWSAILSAEWDVHGISGLTLTGRVVNNSSRYLDPANTWKIPSWTRVDIGARYYSTVGGKAVTYRAGVSNLLDKHYWESAYSGLVQGPPRMFSLSATVDF